MDPKPEAPIGERVDEAVERMRKEAAERKAKEEAIAKQFKQDLLKPVPAGQNKFITALQSAAGSVAGNAGKITKGAAGAALPYPAEAAGAATLP